MPGFPHEVFASWHPLFTCSAAYAELSHELGRRGVEYLNTDLPDRDRVSRTARAPSSRRTAPRTSPTLGDAWPRQFDEFMANADLAFGVLGTELWSGAGLGLGRQAYRALRAARAARVRRQGAHDRAATG